jgi:shikimate kinase
MRSICLVGMPGSGKTTIGEHLSTLIGIPFIDTDKLIEDHFNLSVYQIFKQKGEDEFRYMESQIFKQVLSIDKTIIATGGGLPAYNDNMDLIKKHSFSVYLKIELHQLLNRLFKSNEYKKRPLLAENEGSLTEKRLFAMYEKREPYYLKSDIVIDSNLDIDSCCNLILNNFKDFRS